MSSRFSFIFTLLFVLLCCPSVSRADWINLSGAENSRNIAEITIEKDRVLIQLEVFVEDLMLFEELIPDGFFSQPIPERPGLEERQKVFADQVFQVIADGDQKLSVTFDLVEPRLRVERPSPFVGSISPYTRMPIPGPPEDKRVLYAELSYPFKGQPQTLQFVPPLDEGGRPEASIGFLCNHAGVTVVDFRAMTPATLNLDWDDPWYSEFDNKTLRRKIGSGMRTFLYIEPYEVRNEILVRVKDMMSWVDFELRGEDYIEEDEFNRVREQIGRFFLERENVTIDGQRLRPILDRTAFVESSLLRSRFIEVPERVRLNSAMVGVIITYLTDGIPQEVTTRWELFSDRVQKVTARMTDPAGPFPYDLEPDDNLLTWTNYLKTYTIPTVAKIEVADHHQGVPVPVGSVACVVLLVPAGWGLLRRKKRGGSVKPLIGLVVLLAVGTLVLLPVFQVAMGGSARASQFSKEDGRVILDSLLRNVYRAFDFRDEEDVYDKLTISVSGDLLADLYLEQRKSLLVEQAGGAQAKVEEVAIEDVDIRGSMKSPGALDLKARWTALGQVGHWGHIHTRQNRYDAIVTIKPVDGSWKIIALDLLEETRIDPYAKSTAKR